MNPAPPKPPAKFANRKAMMAYHSELRRWADSLRRWEADLDQRETEIAEAINEYERTYNGSHGQHEEDSDLLDWDMPIDSDDDCECTSENAEAGCDCPPCREWRSRRAQAMMARQQDAVKAGDELQWLEDLWKLPDRRRKKK